ncbi:MAG: hypothetical protein BWY83_02880 [bacterium ADurb.Bin478]|nr:MAG: hypothetical protein BWY83_02880 [bacterium ADurb.Bin478]
MAGAQADAQQTSIIGIHFDGLDDFGDAFILIFAEAEMRLFVGKGGE